MPQLHGLLLFFDISVSSDIKKLFVFIFSKTINFSSIMEILPLIFPVYWNFSYICSMKTFERILTQTIQPLFFNEKAIIIIGARQVGKTTMLQSMKKHTGDSLWLNADENSVRERLANPSVQSLKNIIRNYKTVIIDEVQRIKNAGLLLKLMVDNFKDVQFIATGSSALEISDSIFEPMTGRHFKFHLYPFSLAELYPGKSPFEIEQELHFHLVFGNYPEICIKRDLSEIILKNLSDQYLFKDVLVWKDIRKPELLDKLLKLLAYQMCSEVSVNELANQLRVKSETVENYIDLLEKSFVVYRLKSYGSNPRKEVSKMSKIFFWDNGIRNAVIEDFSDLSSRNDQGQLFENFMISERMKMNTWLNPSVKSFFWRNYNKNEVDYVEYGNGQLTAYEMKWNTRKKYKVTKAFTNLYPNAQTTIIDPENFVGFINIH
ncbi:MAG: ATPase [Bacteroidetes bacterium]|nr:MAG: ATPase [Bacteroidota bacterium]